MSDEDEPAFQQRVLALLEAPPPAPQAESRTPASACLRSPGTVDTPTPNPGFQGRLTS
ncbi:MAG: hypothetical protein JXB32_22975 [Deltaproteobacteria bacterium]|nr:hypothetical protein [Deltaproteobacteria bacterium]